MSNKRIFKVELSGWGETLCYTITTPADTKRAAVVEALTEDWPITRYRPHNWTPQISSRCSQHGWTFGCWIDGAPDIRL